MSAAPPFPVRVACPPGACVCERDSLLGDPHADLRVLLLTREEERKLVERLDGVATLAELRRLELRMQTLLGISVRITPSARGVRTVRGFNIQLAPRPGLCRKTQAAIPAAIRRCLERHPEIAFAILNEGGLLAED
ncbi:hypothetical protein [Janthinobacterium sp.]|uniref:hypothetical protein n=1 Tax=Janthinobacterium sp. TaxID=1871054 RepID=UPI00293D264B|nr:hypothetical protein [Janthinobacterium sp.]